MSYIELLRRAWRGGDYLSKDVPKRENSAPAEPAEAVRRRTRREIESIVRRDAGDAPACLNAHREDIMKLAPFVKFREEKFGAVLFETRSEKVYTLSPTGAAVVREVVAGVESANLAERLKEKYQDPTGKMAKEADSFLAQLMEKGLVTE